MKSRLPNVNEIIAEVRQSVQDSRLTKEASESTSSPYTLPVTKELHRLSAFLKTADELAVTYEDVLELGDELLGLK